MTAALAIGRITVRQVLGLRRLIGLGLLALAPTVIFILSSGTMSQTRLRSQFVDLATALLFATVLPVVTLIISTTALGDERRGDTLSFLVLRPIRRWVIAVSKLATAWLTSLAIVGGSAVLMGIAYGVRSDDWGAVIPLLVAVGVGSALYASIFVPLGFLFERAMLFGLVYVFVWESSIAGAIPGLAGVSPWRIATSAFAGMVDPAVADQIEEFAIGNLDPGAGGALVKTIVVVALSVAATSWLLRRRDLT
jgi:ABC-2 type transport system permease protein